MARIGNLSAAVEAKLKQYARNIGNGTVSVGFLAGSVYDDEHGGMPVATVAFWNEFGTKGRPAGPRPSAEQIAEGIRKEPELVGGSPPRPFFRTAIEKNSSAWPKHLGDALIATRGDGTKALRLMGEEIEGQIVQSINDLTTPALAASTIRRKGSSKPLIDTSVMINSVKYRVD